MMSRTVKSLLKSLLFVMLAVGIILPAALAVAKDRTSTEEAKETRHLVIGKGDGCHLSIATEGSELIITEVDGEDESVTVVDVEEVGRMVGDSLEGVLELVADMQLQMRVGNDNNFTVAFDDEEFEVDLDAIMAEVGAALDGAFDGLDTSDWSQHRHHRTIDVRTDDSDTELQELRRELKELKAELRRLKNLRDEG